MIGGTNAITSNIAWIEVADLTLTSNIAYGSQAIEGITLSHTVTDVSKVGVSFIQTGVTSWSTNARITWESTNGNQLAFRIWNDCYGSGQIDAGAKWRVTVVQMV